MPCLARIAEIPSPLLRPCLVIKTSFQLPPAYPSSFICSEKAGPGPWCPSSCSAGHPQHSAGTKLLSSDSERRKQPTELSKIQNKITHFIFSISIHPQSIYHSDTLLPGPPPVHLCLDPPWYLMVPDGTPLTSLLLVLATGTSLHVYLQNRHAEWEVRVKQWPNHPSLQIVKKNKVSLTDEGCLLQAQFTSVKPCQEKMACRVSQQGEEENTAFATTFRVLALLLQRQPRGLTGI